MGLRATLFIGLRNLAVIVLGGAVAWRVAEQAPANHGEVIVHVVEDGVDVSIDGDISRVNDWRDTPVVRELPPGPHWVSMIRDGTMLEARVFAVRPGDSVVLTLWDPARFPGMSTGEQGL
jgi:hypothetical protein